MRDWLSYAFVADVQGAKCCARVAWVRPGKCLSGYARLNHVHLRSAEADDPLRDAQESAEEPRGRLSEIHELPQNDADLDASGECSMP